MPRYAAFPRGVGPMKANMRLPIEKEGARILAAFGKARTTRTWQKLEKVTTAS